MSEAPVAIPRVDVLGVGVSAVDMDGAIEVVDGWITAGDRRYVCVTGVHGVMESQRDEELRRIHNAAGLVTPDGMPLVWLSKWRGWRNTTRVYGPDLMLALCEHSLTTGYRHFFYGGDEEVGQRLVRRLQKRFPGLVVAGAYAPPFRPLTAGEEEAIVERINESAPDIVWVGLGTPKQERWMAAHVDRLTAAVLIGVGAAFDFHAGTKRQAPLWMQRSGLEWLFRLAQEPRRLWKRYLVNNPVFIWLALVQIARAKSPGARGTGVAMAPTREPQSDRKLI